MTNLILTKKKRSPQGKKIRMLYKGENKREKPDHRDEKKGVARKKMRIDKLIDAENKTLVQLKLPEKEADDKLNDEVIDDKDKHGEEGATRGKLVHSVNQYSFL